jgi:hypothetical protein
LELVLPADTPLIDGEDAEIPVALAISSLEGCTHNLHNQPKKPAWTMEYIT